MFLRFRYEDQLNAGFGLSDLVSPYRFDHFEVELSLDNATADLRINDGGSYEVLSTLDPGLWYNCWLHVDNAEERIQVWLHPRPGEDAGPADQQEAEGQTIFSFRNGTGADLRTFFIKTGGGSGLEGPLLLDDIFMEEGGDLNLSNPIPGVSATPVPSAPAVLQLAPNPFARWTALRFALAEPARASLAILDVTGRRVVELAAGLHERGVHAFTWRGEDGEGRPVPSGVYLVRLSVGDRGTSRRIVLLR
jgi:hypothetical protein